MATVPAGPLGEAPMSDELDLAQSAAGEEDPGASIDLDMPPTHAATAQSQPPAGAGAKSGAAQSPLRPGDEAASGTPGTGEDVCPGCGGSGKQAGRDCPVCQGTGKVTVGIGGA